MYKIALELNENQREALISLIDMVICDYASVLFDAICESSVDISEDEFRTGLKLLREIGALLGPPDDQVAGWDAEIALFGPDSEE